MKVQAYKDTAKRSYPALAKVAALVAVSCAVCACQQQQIPEIGQVPLEPTTVLVTKDKK